VNSTVLNADHDMGGDGKNGGFAARDAYGFNLNYFTGEYKPINTTVTPFPGHSAYLGSAYRPLYNGNISSMAVNIGKFNQPQLYNYQYDQLNRITGMDVYRGLNETNNNWNALAATGDYKERVTYDANGNILKYLRQGFGSNTAMDSLSYNYYTATNKLSHVRDRINGSTAHSSNYTEDLEDQGTNNYTYDETGNLKTDAYENIQHIEWNVYGKIHEINKLSGPLVNSIYIKYFYDPAGNRIGKTEEYAQADAHFNWYARDAQGNVMATYQVIGGWGGQGPLLLKEHHVYGSSRLGVIKRDWDMQQDKYSSVNANLIGPTYLVNLTRGNKLFELSNHLQNNLVVVTDKKTGVSSNGTTVDYYTADVTNAQDYYPFGFVQPNRKYSVDGKLPTFTFNGKMNDGEVKGDGMQLDYGFRIYDPRLAKFLSVDPLTQEYPWYTPYQFAGNSPIENTDLDGAEPNPYITGEFLKGIGRSILRGVNKTITYIANNPNHAGYGYSPKMKAVTPEQIKQYEINWRQQIDPKWHAQQFSENLVYGTTNFVGGIIDGDGERTAQAIPKLAVALGPISIFKGKISISNVTKAGSINKIDIALGKDINLYTFAKRTSSSSFHTWADNIPGYSIIQKAEGFYNFEDAFKYATDAAINTNGRIKFNLEYVNLQQVGQIKPGTGLYQPLKEFGGKSLWEMKMITEWELSQILNNSQLSKIAEFQRMGVSVPESAIRELAKPKK
jgi:RHS repeat-associated protein